MLLEHIFSNEKFNSLEDWYLIDKKLAMKYKTTVSYLISEICSRYDTIYEWRFKRTDNFWTDNNNIIKYLTWLADILGYKNEKDWYNLKRSDLLNNYGNHLYQNYEIYEIPKLLYSDYQFNGWMFNDLKNYFNRKENCIEYLKYIAECKNYQYPEDLYQIKQSDIHKNLTSKYYINDIPKILYPDYDFKEWMFSKTTNKFWSNSDNIVKYLKWLAIRLSFKEEKEWYDLTQEMLNRNYGTTLYLKYAISDIPKFLYPEYEFLKEEFYKNTKQYQLFKYVQSLYPDETVLYDDRSTILNPKTNHYLELDIYVPNLKLAFEYNGIQHYEPKECWGGVESFKEIVRRDKLKKDICEKIGISLIVVKYLDNNFDKLK